MDFLLNLHKYYRHYCIYRLSKHAIFFLFSTDNVDAIVSARIRAADLWLEWALDASHRHKVSLFS